MNKRQKKKREKRNAGWAEVDRIMEECIHDVAIETLTARIVKDALKRYWEKENNGRLDR